MKKLIPVILLFFSLMAFSGPVGIIGAMDKEVAGLKSEIKVKEIKTIAGIEFYSGTLQGKEVVLLKSGIGKVNSAMATDILIREFKAEKIIFTGVAGAVNNKLNVGDVVISTDLAEHDYDTTVFGDKLGDVPGSDNGKFYADKDLIALAEASAQKVLGKTHVFRGTIVTGDQFIADKQKVKFLEDTFGAWAVEMEGASVAHVATLYKVPFVIIRAVSDKADGSAHVTYDEFSEKAAQNSIKIVNDMLKKM
jgi:adenosylhomocysteine nucleosidase